MRLWRLIGSMFISLLIAIDGIFTFILKGAMKINFYSFYSVTKNYFFGLCAILIFNFEQIDIISLVFCLNHAEKAFFEKYFRLPVQQSFCLLNVRASSPRIIGGERLENNRGIR